MKQSTFLFILLDTIALVFVVYSILLHHEEVRVQKSMDKTLKEIYLFMNP